MALQASRVLRHSTTWHFCGPRQLGDMQFLHNMHEIHDGWQNQAAKIRNFAQFSCALVFRPCIICCLATSAAFFISL
jgi:hypothetical protein